MVGVPSLALWGVLSVWCGNSETPAAMANLRSAVVTCDAAALSVAWTMGCYREELEIPRCETDGGTTSFSLLYVQLCLSLGERDNHPARGWPGMRSARRIALCVVR